MWGPPPNRYEPGPSRLLGYTGAVVRAVSTDAAGKKYGNLIQAVCRARLGFHFFNFPLPTTNTIFYGFPDDLAQCADRDAGGLGGRRYY